MNPTNKKNPTNKLLIVAEHTYYFIKILQLRYGKYGEQRLSKDYLFDLYQKHLILERVCIRGLTKKKFLQTLDSFFRQSILGKVSKDGTARKWLTKESPNMRTTNSVNLVIGKGGEYYLKELESPLFTTKYNHFILKK